jgi:hypothetical protein
MAPGRGLHPTKEAPEGINERVVNSSRNKLRIRAPAPIASSEVQPWKTCLSVKLTPLKEVVISLVLSCEAIEWQDLTSGDKSGIVKRVRVVSCRIAPDGDAGVHLD